MDKNRQHEYPEGADEDKRSTPTLIPPIRKVGMDAPIRWLKLGWQDFRRIPRLSLGYGIVMAIISAIITWSAWQAHSFVLAIALVAGFFFIGPALAIGLYSMSCQLQNGKQPELLHCFREGRKNLANELVLSFIFLIIFLIWARSASMVHIFFPNLGDVSVGGVMMFLLTGSAVGAIFASMVFCIGAFSIPLMMDREVDAVTAIITSVAAVLNNKRVMLFWGILIVGGILLGVITGFIGLAVTLPVIGHATWHAYQEVVDASEYVLLK